MIDLNRSDTGSARVPCSAPVPDTGSAPRVPCSRPRCPGVTLGATLKQPGAPTSEANLAGVGTKQPGVWLVLPKNSHVFVWAIPADRNRNRPTVIEQATATAGTTQVLQ